MDRTSTRLAPAEGSAPGPSTAPPDVEFLFCGSPDDAFYSQVAFFRLSLDRLGDQGRAARVVAVLGAPYDSPMPPRWVRHFERIEVHYAPPDESGRPPLEAASDLRYRLVTPGCPCSCLCDADTVPARPLPQGFLDELRHQPAVCGVSSDRAGIDAGFLAGPADLLTRLHEEVLALRAEVRGLGRDAEAGSTAVALAVERAEIPWRALPLRFNYPNDRQTDAHHPEELAEAVLLHYLHDPVVDRQRIFADQQAFESFLTLDLAGGDRAFRDRVLEVTGGAYPFGEAAPASASMVCVLGMHRAGTSATTGVLSRLGIDLGPPEHLMIAREDNPVGFFEHQALSDLNDEILHRLGGSWHEPPVLSTGWQDDPGLLDLRERAARLLREEFGSASRWGWKDPRTCLTLPFWQPMLPDVRYVLCVRSPFDVARSLRARNGFSIRKGIALWMQHMTAAVRHLASAPVLLMVYNDLVEQTEVEVGRLEAFVGSWAQGSGSREAAVRSITDRLRHYQSEPDDLFASEGVWHDASAFYAVLRALAALQRDEGHGPNAPSTFGQWLALYLRREREGREARREVDRLREVLGTARAEAAEAIERLRAELAGAEHAHAAALSALAEARQAHAAAQAESAEALHAARGEFEAARAAVAALERQRDEQVDLLTYLQTPAGAFKAALRASLPTSTHEALRRWGLRWFPDLSRERPR